jgi:hypothetical protein
MAGRSAWARAVASKISRRVSGMLASGGRPTH